MIIDFQHIDASGAEQRFLISKNRSPHSTGKIGNLNRMQDISLQYSTKEALCGIYEAPSFKDCIPFLHWFGVERLSRRLRIETDGGIIARFALSRHGIYKSYYKIMFPDGEELCCYTYAHKSFSYLCFYKGGTQIALAETYLVSIDGKHNHKLYLLDEYEAYADILSLLLLHHVNHTFTKSLFAQKSTMRSFVFTISAYKQMYDPAWRERHFPKENFWGRIL